MAHIEDIRARVAEIATTWPNASTEQTMPYLAELKGYTEEVNTIDHPDAGELLLQIDQLTENIAAINGVPES